MLSFTDFSTRLAEGQLKGTGAVDTNVSFTDIVADQIPTIMNLTNQGLVDIMTRLPLIKKQIDLVFVEDQHIYNLTTGAAYLDDSDSQTDTFVQEDFVKVLDIFDEDGLRYSPNTEGHIMSPTYNSLRFTAAKMTELDPKVRIRYQAKHAAITAGGDIITLPPNLYTALQLFVSSLYISHMNGKDHSAKGDSYFGAYLRHMGEDVSMDKSSTSEVEHDTRFTDKGFV